MDRCELSAAMMRRLGDVFVAALTRAAPDLAPRDLDGIEQGLRDLGRRVFGEVVEAMVGAIAAAERAEPAACPTRGRPLRLVDRARPRAPQGLVGDCTPVRPCFVCGRCRRGQAPLDARRGIGPGALSPGLGRVTCRLGTDGSFGGTPGALEETLRVNVPAEGGRRIAEGIGEVAEAEEQAAMARARAGKGPPPLPAARGAPATPPVEVAGAMVHLEDEWHEVKVGLAAPLGPRTREDPETGRETPVPGRPGYCAGFEAAEASWYRVYAEACRQGLGGAGLAPIVVLGDGADWIWRYAARFLAAGAAEIVESVDISHAFEHLATAGDAVFGIGTPAARARIEPLRERLRAEGAAPVLAALAELAPTEAAAAEEVRRARGYFSEHAARMDYPRFVARRLPIGSGAVESACKTLIEERERGAGMRWTHAGAQAVASLRALHRPGRWEASWRTHPQRRRPPVFPRPTTAPPDRLISQRAA